MRGRCALWLLLAFLAQMALLWWVHRKSIVMRREWRHVIKLRPAQVHVVRLQPFWGPVTAIIPEGCREISKWQARAKTANEVGTHKNTTFESPSTTIDVPHNVSSSPASDLSSSANSTSIYANIEVKPEKKLDSSESPSVTRNSSSPVPSKRHIQAPSPPMDSEREATHKKRNASFANQSMALNGSLSPARPLHHQENSTVMNVSPRQQPEPMPKSNRSASQRVAYNESSIRTTTSRTQTNFTADHMARAMLPILAALKRQEATARRLDNPQGDLLHAEIHAERRLSDDMRIVHCNETMHFQRVSVLCQYLSMLSFSHIVGGTLTIEQLHNTRIRSQPLLFLCIIVCMLLKYSLKVTDLAAKRCGHAYVQLWNQGRTTFDKALESFLLHGVSSIYTLAMQVTICTLYLSFWREDHFIMSFFPGNGFCLFCVTLVLFCVLMVLDRVKGFMNRCGDWYIYTFWSLWLLWMIVLTVPMVGYCCYSFDFVWQISKMGWLREEADIFSHEFALACAHTAAAAVCFVVVALVEFVVIFTLDMEAC